MKFKSIISILITIVVLFFLLGCSEDENNSNQSNDNSNYLWYFSGKLNGESFIYGQKEGETTATYQLATSNTQPSTCVYSSDNGFTYNTGIYPPFNQSLPTMDIEFIRTHLCSDDKTQSEVFNSLFPIREYIYANNNQDIDANAGKVGIYYHSSANSSISYRSYKGSQTNSNFRITKSEAYNSAGVGQLIEGVFNVKLYNQSNLSDVIEITEGRFKIIFTP